MYRKSTGIGTVNQKVKDHVTYKQELESQHSKLAKNRWVNLQSFIKLQRANFTPFFEIFTLKVTASSFQQNLVGIHK